MSFQVLKWQRSISPNRYQMECHSKGWSLLTRVGEAFEICRRREFDHPRGQTNRTRTRTWCGRERGWEESLPADLVSLAPILGRKEPKTSESRAESLHGQ